MTVEIPMFVVEAVAGATVTVVGSLAGVVGVLWRKVNKLEKKAEKSDGRCQEKIEFWQTKFFEEVKRGVRFYRQAPPDPRVAPSVPPPPEDETTGVHELRALAIEQECRDYVESKRKGNH